MISKDDFIRKLKSEFQTSSRVLKAFPIDKGELQPHEKSQTAKRCAWNLVLGPIALQQALDDKFTIPPNFPSAPDNWSNVIESFETESSKAIRKFEEANDSQLQGSVPFVLGPGQMQNIDKKDFFWFVLSDNIHHRGQLSVYLRMAGGKVPSIYGPSADEPWF
ncbi:DinB family protein [bacterium]|nr:DinB family protein [bacterium]MCI0612493.1 DinB family protein [bacterium]